MSFTIGSLFDGSGGFPLAASMCGGIPKWASEIEPYPIAVTKSRFPNVKHLGSVTDIKGGEVEPVDVITFGSPCQDLSVAGKRAGLKHTDNGDDETTRSGLFMEAVRIIKEMREATNGVYPRFALWENVPGAFSSNKGEDFRIVLEELIKIVEPSAVMPPVPKTGWAYADCYCGDGWSLAYRVLDAQHWGVPQRRRRIYLVVDLGGECAGEVLFKSNGLHGYFEEGRSPWQGVTGNAESGVGTADCEGADSVIAVGPTNRGLPCYGAFETLRAESHGALPMVAYSLDSLSSNSMKSSNPHTDMSATLSTLNDQYLFQPICMATQQGGAEIMTDKCPTVTASAGMSGNNQPVVCYTDMVLDDQGGSQISVRDDGKCPTLRAEMHGNIPCVMDAKTWDSRGNGDGKTDSTITGGHECSLSDYTSLVMQPIPIHDQATRFSGKHGEKSDGKGNGLGVGNPGDPMNTLTAGDRHAVCYTLSHGGFMVNPSDDNLADTLQATDYKDPQVIAYGVDARNATEYPGLTGALQADAAHNLNSNNVVRIQYIVRRLTPTECARLQGFPDKWGHPDEKTEFTDEEYQFWLNVRNTHAAINNKPTKDYTKDQILKWYNGLHTDSSEYKMWGNGIALPNALYVMQGIADVMSEEKAARRKWLKDLLGGCL